MLALQKDFLREFNALRPDVIKAVFDEFSQRWPADVEQREIGRLPERAIVKEHRQWWEENRPGLVMAAPWWMRRYSAFALIQRASTPGLNVDPSNLWNWAFVSSFYMTHGIDPGVIRLELEGWDYCEFSEREFRARIRERAQEAVAKAIDDHVAAAKEKARQAGLRQRAKAQPDPMRMSWLVRRWLGEPLAEVARSAGGRGTSRHVAPQTVREAINELAKAVGVELPKGKPGRPKKGGR